MLTITRPEPARVSPADDNEAASQSEPPMGSARPISPEGTYITSFSPVGKQSWMESIGSRESQQINPDAVLDAIYAAENPSRANHVSMQSVSSITSESGLLSQSHGPPKDIDPVLYKARREKHLSTDTFGSIVATVDLEKAALELPEKRQHKIIRHARHTFLNVYRRLFSLVFIFNMVGLAVLLRYNSNWTVNPPLADFATAAAANIMVALLIRQDYIVNACYKMTWIFPLWTPLRIRRILAKVYEYGGVHSGAAVSSVLWFILLTAFLVQQFVVTSQLRSPALLTFTFLLLVLLLSLCITAYPRLRFMSHNTFEQVHRWAGWFSLALFWAELVLFARTQVQPGSPSLGIILIKLPAFWFLLVSSLHAILPWLRLHKLPIEPEALSNHAVRLHFKEPVPLFVGLRISESPLGEWHSFACIPSRDGGRSGGSVLISDAGDWTKRTIQNPKPYYYVKGIPVTGVLCMARIFKRIVIVTTGSGIGPCLGVMQDIPKTHCRVIWSTPNPYTTYGEGIINSVRETDPQAIIWDTRKQGRPDLVRMAYQMYKETDAEAVFVISNPKLTRKVVYGMESRGVPGFGPIWDS